MVNNKHQSQNEILFKHVMKFEIIFFGFIFRISDIVIYWIQYHGQVCIYTSKIYITIIIQNETTHIYTMPLVMQKTWRREKNKIKEDHNIQWTNRLDDNTFTMDSNELDEWTNRFCQSYKKIKVLYKYYKLIL